MYASPHPFTPPSGHRGTVACLRYLLAAALLVACAAHAQSVGLLSPLRALVPDPQCMELQVLGECTCGPLPCGLRVQRYVPVAFVETTRAPGDSLLGPLPLEGSPDLGTISSSSGARDNTSEAHVWLLPDLPLPGLGCLLCSVGSALQGVPAARDEPTTLIECGPTELAAQALAAGSRAAQAVGLPSLAYASEADLINWRTGCRDVLALGLSPGVPAPFDPGNFLGRWGPLRPRQMRDIGLPPVLHSAKTAVRAMSIARDQLGTFPYAVDVQGKLQQLYPSRSACFGVGQRPLPGEGDGQVPVRTSPDGRYGWIYWRRTSCCVGFDAARCLAANSVPVPGRR